MDLFKASSKLTIVNTLNQVLSLVAITSFARAIGAEQLGIFFLFQSLLIMLRIPTDFGLLGAVEKRISEGKYQGEYLSTGIIIKAPPILLAAILVLSFRGIINGYLGADLSILLIIALVLHEYSELVNRVLVGELRVGETAIIELMRQICWIVVSSILILIFSLQARGLVYGLFAGVTLKAILAFVRMDTKIQMPSVERAESLWEYAKYNVVSSVSYIGYEWLDVTIIGLFMSPSAVGIYEIAWKVSSSLLIVSRSFASTLISQVSNWHSDNLNDRISTLVSKGFIIVLLIPIPGFFGILLLSGDILSITFGKEYAVGAMPLIILAFGRCIEAAGFPINRAIHGMNRPDIGARVGIIFVVMNGVLNVVLIPFYGLNGAAVATTASLLVNLVLLYHWGDDIVNIGVPLEKLSYLLLVTLGMSVVTVALTRVIEPTGLLRLLIIIVVSVLVYVTFVWLFGPLKRELVNIYHIMQ